MKTRQTQVSQERYEIILTRYQKYLDHCNDLTKEPVNVFDPLPEKSIKELELIREASRELQEKKEEDIKKAAAAAKQAEQEAAAKKLEETAKAEAKEETEVKEGEAKEEEKAKEESETKKET